MILDTNILIHILQGKEELRFLVEGDTRHSISVITQIELLGHSKLSPHELKSLSDFLTTFRVIPLDEKLAIRASKFRQQGLKTPDAIIAASAQQSGQALLTYDQDFQNCKDIEVITPQ